MGQSFGANNGHRLFVGNMSAGITEKKLRAMMEPFGTVKDVSIVKGHAMDVSSAFVEMTDEDAAARAIAEVNGKTIDGRCLRLRHNFQP